MGRRSDDMYLVSHLIIHISSRKYGSIVHIDVPAIHPLQGTDSQTVEWDLDDTSAFAALISTIPKFTIHQLTKLTKRESEGSP